MSFLKFQNKMWSFLCAGYIHAMSLTKDAICEDNSLAFKDESSIIGREGIFSFDTMLRFKFFLPHCIAPWSKECFCTWKLRVSRNFWFSFSNFSIVRCTHEIKFFLRSRVIFACILFLSRLSEICGREKGGKHESMSEMTLSILSSTTNHIYQLGCLREVKKSYCHLCISNVHNVSNENAIEK